MKTGLFFGTFDPLHIGHIAKIKESLSKGLVDRVMIVPAKQNPWKSPSMFSYEDRVKMCGFVAHFLCIEMFGKDNGKICVSDIESTIEDNTHTWNVLEHLKTYYPYDELSIICGTDVASSIKDWENGEKIVDEYEIICLDREGYTDNEKNEFSVEMSSSIIREKIKNGEDISEYVHPKLIDCIKRM